MRAPPAGGSPRWCRGAGSRGVPARCGLAPRARRRRREARHQALAADPDPHAPKPSSPADRRGVEGGGQQQQVQPLAERTQPAGRLEHLGFEAPTARHAVEADPDARVVDRRVGEQHAHADPARVLRQSARHRGQRPAHGALVVTRPGDARSVGGHGRHALVPVVQLEHRVAAVHRCAVGEAPRHGCPGEARPQHAAWVLVDLEDAVVTAEPPVDDADAGAHQGAQRRLQAGSRRRGSLRGGAGDAAMAVDYEAPAAPPDLAAGEARSPDRRRQQVAHRQPGERAPCRGVAARSRDQPGGRPAHRQGAGEQRPAPGRAGGGSDGGEGEGRAQGEEDAGILRRAAGADGARPAHLAVPEVAPGGGAERGLDHLRHQPYGEAGCRDAGAEARGRRRASR